VTLLSENADSVVCRLEGVGPGGCAVIAKRCPRERGEVEALIYTEVLTRLPLESLHCHGFLAEDDHQYGWLFLEDGGRTSLTSLGEGVPTAIAPWLGVLHSSLSSVQALARLLPDRGPEHYLLTLRTVRQRILEILSHGEMTGEDRTGFENLVSCLGAVEERWDSVRERCGGLPWTLAHGDLKSKNILVRQSESGLTLLAIDWECAGWGPPAVDLARIDCASYWRAVHGRWPNVGLRDVEEHARCGALFNWLMAVGWDLRWGAPENAVRKFGQRLSASARALGLLAV
jgi:aminoglycoside/choline kinase family phosphotransferase